jgi:hypothetical protein
MSLDGDGRGGEVDRGELPGRGVDKRAKRGKAVEWLGGVGEAQRILRIGT